MAKLTSKLQIWLWIGGGLILFFSVPLVLVCWLLAHQNSHSPESANQPAGSYYLPPTMDWTRLVTRSLDPKHARLISAANHEFLEAKSLVREGKNAEARKKFNNVIAVFESELGPDSFMALTAGLTAGRAEADSGNWSEAESFLQRVVDNSAKLSFNHYTCIAMQWLARAKESNNNIDGAEAVLSKCLSQQEKAIGNDSPDLIYTLDALASIISQKQEKRAEDLYKQALAIALKKQKPEQIKSCYRHLAYFYGQHEKYAESAETHLKLLELAEKSNQIDWRAFYLESLFKDYLNLKNYKELRVVAYQALDLRRQEKKPNFLCIVHDLVNEGLVESLDNNEDKSKALINEALDELNSLGQKQNPSYDLAFQSTEFAKNGKWPQAEMLLNATVAYDKKNPNNYNGNRSKMQLAQLMAYEGKYAKSKELLKGRITEADPSRLAAPLADLILLDLCIGDKKEANSFYKQWLQIQAKPISNSNDSKSLGKDKQTNAVQAASTEKPHVHLLHRSGAAVSACYLACLEGKPKLELKKVSISKFGKFVHKTTDELSKLIEQNLK